MEAVPETPDGSEEESITNENSIIIDGSLEDFPSSEGSLDTSLFNDNSIIAPVKKTHRPIIIDSDSEDDDDEPDVQVIENTSPIKAEKQVSSLPDVPVIEDTTPIKTGKQEASSLPDVQVIDYTSPIKAEKQEVSSLQHEQQQSKVKTLSYSLQKMKNFIREVNMDKLPDKGASVLAKLEKIQEDYKLEESKLQEMVIRKDSQPPKLQPIAWNKLENDLGRVEPKTFGKKAMETYNVQKALTLDRLEQLHGSLKNCPTADTEMEQPKGLKIELMPHQKHALAWSMWREQQKPSGGILADDMGLGKTLTMISLILKVLEDKDENGEDENDIPSRTSKYPGGTLVVCPASVIYQWESEIKKHVKKGLLTIGMYHGTDRDKRAKRLAKHNIVLTTFALVMGDSQKGGPLFEVKWERVVVDEAHQIRNHKSQTSTAMCELSAKSRWALTGTPIHNKELDLYALMKFLRCSPFDDLPVWKRWVANKQVGGQDRLNTVMSSLLLRRTKQELAEQKVLNCLPEKSWTLVTVKLEKEETNVYQKVLIFSRTLFAQFLYQRAQKHDALASEFPSTSKPNEAYFKMHDHLLKLNKVQAVKQHDILTLLLRLRQICCHPSLITGMLNGEENLEVADDDEVQESNELNLIEQLNKLTLGEHEPDPVPEEGAVGLAVASRNLLNPSNPVFAEDRQSSKMKVILKLIVESIENDDKVIVISQWKRVLDLLAIQLKINDLAYYQLDGSVKVSKRVDIVENFNNSKNRVQILLLSLTAGGVGLNLIGANRLILTDLHWNPQLEMQAQDRIYRVGQKKPVKIYKLMAVDTIEERIKNLQDKKLDISNSLLTGVQIREQSKLSLNDLKLLFNM